jgi:hypothetical protein
MIKQPIPKPSGWDSWNDDQKWNYVLLFCEHLENLIQKQGGAHSRVTRAAKIG